MGILRKIGVIILATLLTIKTLIGKLIGVARNHWLKFGIAGIVLIVAAVIINHDIASGIIFLFGIAIFALGVIGVICNLLASVFRGTKKLGKKVGKSFNTVKNKVVGGTAKRKSSSQKKSTYSHSDDDDIVTLYSSKGEEIDFVEIAGIAHRGNFYAILQPVELLDGMDDDEALVFKVTRDRNGDDHFEIELDDTIIDAVFREYNRLLDQANK